MISIIIPTHNRKDMLRRAINSVLEQTYSDLEVLVVSDGCTDGTNEMLGELKKRDRRLRYIINDETKGVSKARNRGIENAQGEYISFLDDDDIIHPQFIGILYEYIEKFHTDISICQYARINKEGALPILNNSAPQKLGREDILSIYKCKRRTRVNFFCCLYRKKIIDVNRITFPENLRYGEDTAFFLKYTYRCLSGGIFIRESLYAYYSTIGSASKDKGIEREEILEAYKIGLFLWERDSAIDKELIRYINYRAVWAVTKDMAYADKAVYVRFVNTYDVMSAMKYMAAYAEELLVRLSAVLYLLSPGLFRFAIRLI